MKKNKESDKLVKLKEYINKYNFTMKDLLFSARLEISDIIFEEHQIGCYWTDAVLIGIQLLFVLIGLICGIFGLHISTITCCITIIILAVVLLNNVIHDYSWRKAKKRFNDLCELLEEAEKKCQNK